jgi:hypothetical protein
VTRLLLGLALLAPVVSAQQNYVGRFDVFGGFSYLESPHVNLAERGFQFQVGVRPKSWYTLGFDYSVSTGHFSLAPNLLTTSLQAQLGAQLAALVAAHVIPPTYTLSVPLDSTTQTFAAGPQFAYHRWKPVTLFIRPSIGAIHEIATPHATDPVAAGILAQLAPSGKKTDWVAFYGFGGGFDANLTEHFAIRFQGDFVHDHLFSDLLQSGRNTVRFSVGPAFQFGSNAKK